LLLLLPSLPPVLPPLLLLLLLLALPCTAEAAVGVAAEAVVCSSPNSNVFSSSSACKQAKASSGHLDACCPTLKHPIAGITSQNPKTYERVCMCMEKQRYRGSWHPTCELGVRTPVHSQLFGCVLATTHADTPTCLLPGAAAAACILLASSSPN
jgi:hypothetical protein